MRDLLVIVFLACVLLGCERTKSIKVADVTEPATVTLTAPEGAGQVRFLFLNLRGDVSGSGAIGGDNIETQRFSGQFDITVKKPWEATNCVLHYTPAAVHSGSISIRYRFTRTSSPASS